WLTLPILVVLGWANVLIATRLVTVTATLLTGVVLAWLVHRLFGDRVAAALAALIYLSGDTLIYHGWLAYSDPTYAFFIFAAIACLWVAVAERRIALLLLAAVALAAAALTKALTGYLFYGVFGLVLLWRHANGRFLLKPSS